MAKAEKPKTKTQILALLKSLYLLKAKDGEELSKSLKFLSEQGLNEVLKILLEGQSKQNDTLKKLISTNPVFEQELRDFLKKEYQGAQRQAEKKEHEQAENLLNDLSL